MANQEHLDILKQGIEGWNKWRLEHPDIQLNLSRADLSHADLSHANLRNADLRRADLRDADLSNADLSNADLTTVTFSGANLSKANLSGADLSGAEFVQTHLEGTDFTNTYLEWTVFAAVDLGEVKGLETALHAGPSFIGIDTIYHAEGNIPEGFLEDAGVPASFIEYMRSLVVKPIDFYSCFISVRLVSPKHAQAWGWAGKEYSFYN